MASSPHYALLRARYPVRKENATSDTIEKRGREEGMLTMLEEGFIKAAQKITSIEEVLRVTSE